MKARYRLGTGVFTTAINHPDNRVCDVCGHSFPAHLRLDTESADGTVHSYCFFDYKQMLGVPASSRVLRFEDLPSTVTFSQMEAGGVDAEDQIEFGTEDGVMADAGKEDTLLFVLKTLPKDRYRVITLMLYLREQGFAFRYEDIASIWGFNKAMVRMTMKRMQAVLKKAGISEEGIFKR